MNDKPGIFLILILTAWIFSILLTGCQQVPEELPTPSAAEELIQPLESTPAPILTQTAISTATSTNIPTVTPTQTPEETPTPLPTLTPAPPPFFDTFVVSIVNGNSSQIVGVYVDGVLALKIVQQPADNPGYVSELEETATYFAMVQDLTGNTGLLAHNYLAGIYYYDLLPGQIVVLIYGSGNTEEYIVTESEQFQASNPNSPTSNFVDIATGETLTSTDLFYRVYGGSLKTTFQTCIAQGDEGSWGRLFVIAPQE